MTQSARLHLTADRGRFLELAPAGGRCYGEPMRLLRFLFGLAALGALAYVVVAVPVGSKTIWQHLRAIAGSRESQELVDEVKQRARRAPPDSGAPPAKSADRLSAEERKLLRKLIREKLGDEKKN